MPPATVFYCFLVLVHLGTLHQVLEVHLMGIEFRPVTAGELAFIAHLHPAAAVCPDFSAS